MPKTAISRRPIASRFRETTEIMEQYIGQTNVLLFFRIIDCGEQLGLNNKQQ